MLHFLFAISIANSIAALVAAHPGQTVVAVSHADPIKAAVALAIGTHLDLFQRIVISPCNLRSPSLRVLSTSVKPNFPR